MASWQAGLTSFLLRHLFKPQLARARVASDFRKVMNGPGAAPLLSGTRADAATVGGVGGEWVTADAAPSVGTLLYLHGGGYVACTPGTHRPVTCAFARAGFRTFAPDYRLAPEHPFPAAVEDAVSVYRALLNDHAPRGLVVAGDSAGGGLCAALLLSLRDAGLPMPAAAVLFSPFVDLLGSGESVTRNARRCAMFTGELFARAAEFYVGAGDRRAPLASPVYADLRGLPPLLVHVGEDETLLDDSRRLVENAKRAGVAAELKIWPAVPHVWQLFHRWIPEGRESLREAAAFCERRSHSSKIA
jgi:acetyl esterase/lipase